MKRNLLPAADGPADRPTHLSDELPEEQFIRRYRWLLAWALRLTDQCQEDAEDLLQTAFVQLALRRPRPEEIQNLDGYFYTLLRNLWLSHVRRFAARAPKASLSILDFDSAELGLRRLDPRTLQRAHDDLRLVCRYACLRKESSKTASVLLLRFFHGYYPSEIARLMAIPPPAVSEWLRLARAEARACLQNPSTLRTMTGVANGGSARGSGRGVQAVGEAEEGRRAAFPAAAAAHAGPQGGAQGGEIGVMEELLDEIFASSHGPCLSRDELRSLTSAAAGRPAMAAARLAHLVSCRRCLTQASRALGLDEASDRDPFDSIGPQARPPAGGGDASSGGGAGSTGAGSSGEGSSDAGSSGRGANRRATAFGADGGGRRGGSASAQAGAGGGGRDGGAGRSGGAAGGGRPRHAMREVIEHEPAELQIAVDGFVIGILAVGRGHHELSLTVNGTQTLAFLEVFSEQGVELLYADPTPPPAGAPRQQFAITLSGDRRLVTRFDFSGPWPTVQLEYDDPRPVMSIEAAASQAMTPAAAPDPETDAALAAAARIAAAARGAGWSQDTIRADVGRALSGENLSTERLPGEQLHEDSSPSTSARASRIPRVGRAWAWLRTTFVRRDRGDDRPDDRRADSRPNALRRRFVHAGAIAGVLLAAVIGVEWGAMQWGNGRVSAAELLAEARVHESQLASRPDVVTYRSLRLEVRRLPERTPRRTHRIDVWHSAARGVTARRVFDEGGRLIAGEWIARDGRRMVYRPGEAARPDATEPGRRLTPDEAWRMDLSADTFARLVGADAVTRATTVAQGEQVEIRYAPNGRGDGATAGGDLVAATLTVSRPATRVAGAGAWRSLGGIQAPRAGAPDGAAASALDRSPSSASATADALVRPPAPDATSTSPGSASGVSPAAASRAASSGAAVTGGVAPGGMSRPTGALSAGATSARGSSAGPATPPGPPSSVSVGAGGAAPAPSAFGSSSMPASPPPSSSVAGAAAGPSRRTSFGADARSADPASAELARDGMPSPASFSSSSPSFDSSSAFAGPFEGGMDGESDLASRDTHAIAAVIIQREGDAAYEYRFSEVVRERLPLAEVPDERFVPDVALLPARPLATPAPAAAPVVAPRPAEPPAPTFDPAQLDRLELDATYRLHRLGGCAAPDAIADRVAGGIIRVRGRLTAPTCAAEVARVFGPVKDRPELDVRLTDDETGSGDAAAVTAAAILPTPAQLDALAVTALLRTRVDGDAAAETAPAIVGAAAAARPSAEEATRARAIVSWAFEQRARLDGHAARLARLVDQWPAERLARLDLDDRTIWQQMLRDEADALASRARELRMILGPRLWPASPDAQSDPHGPASPPALDLTRAAQRARTLATAARESAALLAALLAVPAGAPPLPATRPLDTPPRATSDRGDAGEPRVAGRTLPTTGLASQLSDVERLGAEFSGVWVLEASGTGRE